MNKVEYIKDLYKDEIRSGFLVTASRKKVWNKEIEILMLIDNICRKYNIKYFADSGTLLGAARHQGFIPWDDDIDIIMPRPDYEKFQIVVNDELPDGYFFQSTYTDNRILYFGKVMDECTSAIEYKDIKNLHQGIFVDIFPLDVVGGSNPKIEHIMRIAKELWMLVITPKELIKQIEEYHSSPAMPIKTINSMLRLTVKERLLQYEEFMLTHYEDGEYVHNHVHQLTTNIPMIDREVYENTVMLPFENISIPAPANYDVVLKSYYGNWHKMVRGQSQHEGLIMSADIPYKKMLEDVDF